MVFYFISVLPNGFIQFIFQHCTLLKPVLTNVFSHQFVIIWRPKTAKKRSINTNCEIESSKILYKCIQIFHHFKYFVYKLSITC